MEKTKHNFYQRGDGEAGGIIAIAFIALIVWGVYSFFGWGEREGAVRYDDCRAVVMLSSDTWQKFYKTFTCSYAKTQSGKIMTGVCVHIDTAGTAFSASSACETAYVYEKKPNSPCTVAPNIYLGYDDMCHTTPQGGEVTVSPAPDTSSQTPTETPGASAAIDQSSLFSASPKPTITGTFSNLSGGIGIFIATQPLPKEISPNGPTPAGVVFSDASDHGGGVGMSTAGTNASGTYSDTFWQALPNGSYYVGIYQISTIYNSSGFQGYSTSYLLTSGTLTVNAH